MLNTLSFSINEIEIINSFEFEIFATMYDRDIVFAKFEIILNFQKKRRHDFNDRFEFVDDNSTFYKNIRRYIE